MTDMDLLRKDADYFYQEAFKRNIGILTEEDQARLRKAKIAIVGCGGVGGAHLMNCVRLGIGRFHIADMDTFDAVNIQRQCGAALETLGKNKAASMKDAAMAVNPHLEIREFCGGVTEKNLEDFLDGVDVLIDGIDFFCVDMRRKLFMHARENGIYTITAGPLGFGTAMLIFAPGEAMSFDHYFDISDEMSYLKKIIAFAVGLAPAALHMGYMNLGKVDPTAKSGPALMTSCSLASALAVTEAIKILTGRGKVWPAPYYMQVDPFLGRYRRGRLLGANRHPLQRFKRWFLYRKFREYET